MYHDDVGRLFLPILHADVEEYDISTLVLAGALLGTFTT